MPPTSRNMAPAAAAGKPGMAGKPAGAGLLAKLGDRLKRANAQHKNDETKISASGDIPGGVSGIAQLSACKFDTHKEGDNAGKYFFYAAGIIQEPDTFTDKLGNVHRIRGKRTSIQCPLYDTPERTRKTVEEHVAWLYNELRKLGVNTASFPDPMYDGFLEGMAAALVKAAPYFEFHTFEGAKSTDPKYKDRPPMITHIWDGKTDYSVDMDPAAGLVETPPPANMAAPSHNGHAASQAAAPQAAATIVEEPPVEISPEELDQSDITSLLNRANRDDGTAQQRLVDMAIAAGYDEATVTSPDVTWEQVVDMINTPSVAEANQEGEGEGEGTTTEGEGEGEGEATSEGEAEAVSPPPPPPPPPAATVIEPVKGKVYKYKPLDPSDKTGKTRVKKPIDCEATAVDKRKKTCTLKSLVDGRTIYNNVSWSVLAK